MKNNLLFFGLTLIIFGCKSTVNVPVVVDNSDVPQKNKSDFTIAFGSCNRTEKENLLWDDIAQSEPSVWIWGGDNIYADTDDMARLSALYDVQKKIESYALLISDTPIIGTWDDHDYGLNDGGVEFNAKKGSQQMFLDFMEVPQDSPRRTQEGIYTSHHYTTTSGTISVFVLDTRYFRTAVTPDTDTDKRLRPNPYGEGTVLGETQWDWLTKQLSASTADFNVIVSSIQLLSNEHGFECWGNFPHEVDRLKKLIVTSGAEGVIVLSGDRHISEFSKDLLDGLDYPLIDFTSSGLTHAYSGFSGEPNPFRVGEVVFTESFGTLEFDFTEKQVLFKMIGDGGEILGEMVQKY